MTNAIALLLLAALGFIVAVGVTGHLAHKAFRRAEDARLEAAIASRRIDLNEARIARLDHLQRNGTPVNYRPPRALRLVAGRRRDGVD